MDAVLAWEYSAMAAGYGLGAVAMIDADLPGLAAKMLADAIARAAGPDSTVRVRPLIVEGHPAQVLPKAARDADLLVVGSRGHGGFAGALLGSVNQHCAQHAPGPVVVVRGGPCSAGAADGPTAR